MKPHNFLHWIILPLFMVLAALACTLPTGTPAPPPIIVITQNVIVQPQQTQVPAVTEKVVVQNTNSPTIAAACTVVQDVNLRTGPGTVYRPPIDTLDAGDVITPLGFVPKGALGGTWAYVRDLRTQNKGWVSAGAEYISCNVDITSFPAVAFDPPPAPKFPKSAQNSDPDGNSFCIDPSDNLGCIGVFADDYLFQFQITRDGNIIGKDNGVENVSFSIQKKDADGYYSEVIYSVVENNTAYCIFGGDGPCNSWVNEDSIYKWWAGGPKVENGEYKMNVNVTVRGEDSHWEVVFVVQLP